MDYSYQKKLRLNEFSLIEKYFKQQQITRTDVVLGVGDDAALVIPRNDCLLVLAIDTMVEGIHFLSHTSPADIAYKALAVNLSDLAAMGAEPAWMTLALTMPEANKKWLDSFTEGLYQLAAQFNIQLIGGDTTHGPLTITIQVHGFVPTTQVLRRSGAQAGDKIYVSGTLGDAGLGLKIVLENYKLSNSDKSFVLQRLQRPCPQIKLGTLLRGLATSAIDVSDGLLADLNHILESSNCGAQLYAQDLPFSAALENIPLIEAQQLALTSGDDYELCFTVSQQNEKKLLDCLSQHKIRYSCIGEIEDEPGIRISGFSGDLTKLGYQNF